MKTHEAKDFIFAGRAVFTVVGATTSFTFSLKKKGDNMYFVYLKSDTWVYLGWINRNSASMNLPTINGYPGAVTAFDYTIRKVLAQVEHPIIEILPEGKCGKCSRPLTDPESIRTGLGPKCRGTCKRN